MINVNTKNASSSGARKNFDPLKFARSWLFFAAFRRRRRAIDLGLKARGHFGIALRGGKLDAFLKHLDRARYVAVAE